VKSKKWYVRQMKKRPIEIVRYGVQLAFLFFLLYVGLRFYQFYMHFSTMGAEPFVERPSAVEGFLPISALVALKVWLLSGEFDRIHPAGLILFTFFVGSSLVFRKAFCGWICPIGTVSEWTGKLGKKLFKKNFDLPKWVIWLLTPLKYILLAFFLVMVLNMPVPEAKYFLSDSYNKVSDVKMLQFFLHIGGLGLKVIVVLFVLSLFFKNFWCRFLCPYGALIGLGSLLGISKIKRNVDTCISCEQCTKVCPQRIKVSEKKSVLNPECTACMQLSRFVR
jgi:polyferredoxin